MRAALQTTKGTARLLPRGGRLCIKPPIRGHHRSTPWLRFRSSAKFIGDRFIFSCADRDTLLAMPRIRRIAAKSA